jgi:hypothetical protein
MAFANEQQVQEWMAEQRAAGRSVSVVGRSEGERFITEPIAVEWSFGGVDAFREIGRVALNFLAHTWPEVARDAGLRGFKDWVIGTRALGVDEPRHVWYAPRDAAALPPSPFPFGHQVLVVLDAGSREAYARVRFFSSFDLYVWFGRLSALPVGGILVDIDPHANQAPDDLRVQRIEAGVCPATVDPPRSDEPPPDTAPYLHECTSSLLRRVDDYQWQANTGGLLGAVNATVKEPRPERDASIARLLHPHRGLLLRVARSAIEQVKAFATLAPNPDVTGIAECFETLFTVDRDSRDGLGELAGTSLERAAAAVASAIAARLDQGPLLDGDLRNYLRGNLGAHAISQEFLLKLALSAR